MSPLFLVAETSSVNHNAFRNTFLILLDIIFSKMTFKQKLELVEDKYDLKLKKRRKGRIPENDNCK